MKYKIAALSSLVLILLMLLPCIGSFGAESASISVETNKIATVGNTFTVKISLEENPGFSELTLNLTYDSEHMILERVEYDPSLDEYGVTLETSENIGSDPYVLTLEAEEDISVTGVILVATFTLDSADLSVEYPISVSAPDGSMCNSAGQEIDLRTTAGGVYLDCYHNFVSQTYEPRCDAEGYTEYACTECQKRYQSNFVDPTPHSWRTVSSVDPTCTEQGTLTRRCMECDHQETVGNGDALGHIYAPGVTVPPTCSEQGYTLHSCQNCTFEYSDSFTPALGHVYEENIIYDSTCTDEGLRTFVCSVCDAKKEYSSDNVIPKRECDFVQTSTVPATHEKRGYTVYECTYCKSLTKNDYIEIIPYHMEYEVTRMPTCTEEGHRHGVCTDGCGYEIDEIIEPTGHLFNDWVTNKQPTSSEKGLRSRSCASCGHTETDEIPMIVNQATFSGLDLDFLSDIAESMGLSLTQIAIICVAMIMVLFILLLLIIFICVARAAGKKRSTGTKVSIRKVTFAADREALRSVTAAVSESRPQSDDLSAEPSEPSENTPTPTLEVLASDETQAGDEAVREDGENATIDSADDTVEEAAAPVEGSDGQPDSESTDQPDTQNTDTASSETAEPSEIEALEQRTANNTKK